jgi:hypothetical protein
MDPNLKVPLNSITNGFTRCAKRATNPNEKKYLYDVTEAVGTAILQHTPGLTVEEFLRGCGVDPEWGKIAA